MENKINELIENLIPESITVHGAYIKFVSNNKNIKLTHLHNNEEIIYKIISYGCFYLATKISNNDENINDQFIKSSGFSYADIIGSLIESDLYIRVKNKVIQAESGTIWISKNEYFFEIELLIELGSDLAIIKISWRGHLLIVKLLIDSDTIFMTDIIRSLLSIQVKEYLT